MKNPSKAGNIEEDSKKMLSDDTVYKVCDYIYKHRDNFSRLIILNLFPIYGSTFKNIVFNSTNELIGSKLEYSRNNVVISEVIASLTTNGDRIILAWGGYPNLSKSKKVSKTRKKQVIELYKRRIKEVLNIIADRPTYKVGEGLTDGKFPQHGKMWYDFDPLQRFSHPDL